MNQEGTNKPRNLHLPTDKVENVWDLDVVEQDEKWDRHLAHEAEYNHYKQLVKVDIFRHWLDLFHFFCFIIFFNDFDPLLVWHAHRIAKTIKILVHLNGD